VALTGKRVVFLNEYLRTRNATEAARIAGYAVPMQEGYRLLRNVEIRAEIDRRLTEDAMPVSEALTILAEQANADMSDFVTFYPGLKLPVLDLEKAHQNGKMRLIKKLKFLPDGGVEFELYDAQAAAVWIAKTGGAFTDKQQITGKDGGPVMVVVDF